MALGLGLGVVILSSGVRDVKLGKHVARWEDHLLQICGVPGGKNQTAIVWVGAQLVNNLSELVNSLACVVRLGVDVLGAKMPPLEAVHGAEVADLAVVETEAVKEFARAVAVPDLDAGLAEARGGCVSLDEPEELGDNGTSKDALGGEEGEDWGAVIVEGELEGSRGKDGVCACTGSMNAVRTMSVIGGLPLSYLSGRRSPVSRISFTRSKYWCSSWLTEELEPLEGFSAEGACEAVILVRIVINC